MSASTPQEQGKGKRPADTAAEAGAAKRARLDGSTGDETKDVKAGGFWGAAGLPFSRHVCGLVLEYVDELTRLLWSRISFDSPDGKATFADGTGCEHGKAIEVFKCLEHVSAAVTRTPTLYLIARLTFAEHQCPLLNELRYIDLRDRDTAKTLMFLGEPTAYREVDYWNQYGNRLLRYRTAVVFALRLDDSGQLLVDNHSSRARDVIDGLSRWIDWFGLDNVVETLRGPRVVVRG